jgi:hypothetical protein
MGRFTLVEWMVILAIAGILLVIGITNVVNYGKTPMQVCAEQCGPDAAPALLPAGKYGLQSCACLPRGMSMPLVPR